MKLTPDQISEIKAFISQRGFVYPDVQLEIIDHVASRVEELITNNTALSLAEAINTTYAEFGEMGFSVFEDALKKGLRKKYFRLFCQVFLSWFSWKYIPAMVVSLYLIDKVYVMINQPYRFVVYTFLLSAIGFFVSIMINISTSYKYGKLLTRRISSYYLFAFSLVFNLWNFLGVELKLYQSRNIHVTAITFGISVLVVVLLFITVNQVRQAAIKSCIELDQKYHLLNNLAA